MRVHFLLRIVLISVIAILFSGCIAHKNSNKVKGSVSELQMLNYDELTNALGTNESPQVLANYTKRLGQVIPSRNKYEPKFVPLLPVIAPILVAAATDAVVSYSKTQLTKEAAKHEAQFTTSAYRNNFYDPRNYGKTITEDGNIVITNCDTVYINFADPQNCVVRYAGFQMLRWTKDYPKSKGKPAMRLIVAFGGNEDDSRWLTIHPIFFKTIQSQAKLGFFNSELTTEFRVGLSASWVDQKMNRVMNQQIFDVLEQIKSYNLDKAEPVYFWSDASPTNSGRSIIGAFPIIPISYLETDTNAHQTLRTNDHRATPFNLTLQVTERDESKVKECIEYGAKYLGDNKASIIKAAQESLGGANSNGSSKK